MVPWHSDNDPFRLGAGCVAEPACFKHRFEDSPCARISKIAWLPHFLFRRKMFDKSRTNRWGTCINKSNFKRSPLGCRSEYLLFTKFQSALSSSL